VVIDGKKLKEHRRQRKLQLNGTTCGSQYGGNRCLVRNGKPLNERCLKCEPFLADNPQFRTAI